MTQIAAPPPRRQSMSDPPSLARITTKTRRLPSRIVFHAAQKFMKTSWAAQAPGVVFALTRSEDGLDTLIDAGQLPETPHFEGTLQTWNHVMMSVEELITYDHPHKTFALDTFNGAVQLAQEHIVTTKYGGDFEKFDAFGRGGARLLPSIIELTSRLDRLREKGMAIILLAHSEARNVKNPEGLDYPRWEPPIPKEVLEHISRWADAILFGQFQTFVEKADKNPSSKGKAVAQQTRIIQVVNHATFASGNRLGLSEPIECGNSAAEAWANFTSALKAARNKKAGEA